MPSCCLDTAVIRVDLWGLAFLLGKYLGRFQSRRRVSNDVFSVSVGQGIVLDLGCVYCSGVDSLFVV